MLAPVERSVVVVVVVEVVFVAAEAVELELRMRRGVRRVVVVVESRLSFLLRMEPARLSFRGR